MVAREGGQPDMCFMNFASYAALENALGAKVQYVDVKHEEADIAFAGIRIHAPLTESAVFKFSLIDLEARKLVTGRKANSHRERLSERTRKGCDSLNFGITKEAKEPKSEETSRPQSKDWSNKFDGPITVVPDRNCPSQTAYLLSMDTWKLRSLGKAPHVLTYGLEGLEGLRVGAADALEIRIGYYGNLICNAPGWNCTVSLSQ